MELPLKYCFSRSAGLAVIVSLAIYLLTYFLLTTHAEIGISADVAFPIALWTFPVAFLGSMLVLLVKKARPGNP
jgi:lipopolysaccharide export LptBFGC system permease protein LptF